MVGVRIIGEPGVGKSRLLAELGRQAEACGCFVVTTGPDPHWAEVPYHALREAIRALAGLGRDDIRVENFPGADPEARRGLAEIFSGMPRREDPRASAERRHAVAEGLRWALETAARRHGGPLVVVVEDLQRVDAPSKSAFADVLVEPPDCGAFIIGSHVPGCEPGWDAERAAARVIGGFSIDVTARLLRSSIDAEQLAMLEESFGRGVLPLYIEQLLRYTMEGGRDAPARLADLIALRVDTLSNARRALQALVVYGDAVQPQSLARLVPQGDDIAGAFADLARTGLVVADEGGHVSVAHPLLDVVLSGIPLAVRRELHEKALVVCDKLSAPLEARALHAYYAEDAFQALLLLEQVAERAAFRDDHDAETLALRRALEMARQEISRGQLDDPLRAMLIFSRKLGSALTRYGDYADAEGVLREALDIAGPSDLGQRAEVLRALAEVAHGRRRAEEAIGYLDQAIEAARRSGALNLLSSLSDTRRTWAS